VHKGAAGNRGHELNAFDANLEVELFVPVAETEEKRYALTGTAEWPLPTGRRRRLLGISDVRGPRCDSMRTLLETDLRR